jgi:DNA polymerase III sliding clamp (beta) subunit (PCNA family)
MPILSHVLLEAAKGDELQVSATDLDISVSFQHASRRILDQECSATSKFATPPLP